MSFKLVDGNGAMSGVRPCVKYQISAASDLNGSQPHNLRPGDIAFLADNSRQWRVNNEGTWVEMTNIGGGGGGGSADIATDEEIQSIIDDYTPSAETNENAGA